MKRFYPKRRKLVLRIAWNLTKNELWAIYQKPIKERKRKAYKKFYRQHHEEKLAKVKAYQKERRHNERGNT